LPDLGNGEQPIYSIELSEVQRIIVDNTHPFCFGIVTTCKGNRTFLLSAESKKAMGRWILLIDGLKNIEFAKFQSSMDIELKHNLLNLLFMEGFSGGMIKFFSDSGSTKPTEEWQYSSAGTLKNLSGVTTLDNQPLVFHWNAARLSPATSDNDFGYGIWDGVRLAWFNSDGTLHYPYNFMIENQEMVNTDKYLSCELEGTILRTSGKQEWRILDGDVPECILMFLQIIRLVRLDRKSNRISGSVVAESGMTEKSFA